MRIRGGAVMSAVLNIAGAALVLPNTALALFFLGVGIAARQTLGTLLQAFGRMLLELPPFEYLPFLALPVIVVIVAMIRMPILLPLSILAVGVVSSLYVFWTVGPREGAASPLTWLSAVGLVLAGIQVWRSLQNDVA